MRSGEYRSALWAALRDPITGPALVCVAVATVLDLRFGLGISPYLFPLLAVVAIEWGVGSLPSRREQRFWHGLAIGFGSWIVLALSRDLQLGLAPPAALFFERVLEAFCVILLIAAIERSPPSRDEPLYGLARVLAWPATVIFLVGLLVYFLGVPGRADLVAEHGQRGIDIALRAYVTLRLIGLARMAKEPRWRAVFAAMVLSPFFDLISVVLGAVTLGRQEMGLEAAAHLFRACAFATLIPAIRLRHCTFSAADHRVPRGEHLKSGFRLSTRTLVMTLVLPVVHVVMYRIGWLSEELRPDREVVVLAWLMLLGGMALVQHVLLERRAQKMWLDRLEMEEALRGGDKDLRVLVEQHALEEVERANDERFNLAFNACPYGLSLHSREDGRFFEVNPAATRFVGLGRDDLVGHSGRRLGLWTRREELRLRRALAENSEVRELEITLGAEKKRILISAAPLEIHGVEMWMVISRPVPQRRRRLEALRVAVGIVEDAPSALFSLSANGRLEPLNPAASSLGGAAPCPLAKLFDDEAAAELGDIARSGGVWTGEARVDGKPSEVWAMGGDDGAVVVVGA